MSLPFLLNSEDNDLKILGEIVVCNEWFVHVSKRSSGAYIKSRSVREMHRNTAKMLFGNHEDLYISEDILHVTLMDFAYGRNFFCPSKLNSIILRLSAAGLYEKL
ncbi:hypothetical protein HNY73_014812 [Argiope bruennichi]|uniref:Uncharacterized protein n=1 Tax=Argiope bruennichi TaxID=94029 RepID=A0A8T0ERZ9_ARGBR|nr:hypothetical protein HNY73_014812 [Argiope bruennichi]